MQFITNMRLLHVSAPGCHLQGVSQNKGIYAQHISLGATLPYCIVSCGHTTHAPSGRDHFGSRKIEIYVCMLTA
jgi:hypothetical protein